MNLGISSWVTSSSGHILVYQRNCSCARFVMKQSVTLIEELYGTWSCVICECDEIQSKSSDVRRDLAFQIRLGKGNTLPGKQDGSTLKTGQTLPDQELITSGRLAFTHQVPVAWCGGQPKAMGVYV